MLEILKKTAKILVHVQSGKLEILRFLFGIGYKKVYEITNDYKLNYII